MSPVLIFVLHLITSIEFGSCAKSSLFCQSTKKYLGFLSTIIPHFLSSVKSLIPGARQAWWYAVSIGVHLTTSPTFMQPPEKYNSIVFVSHCIYLDSWTWELLVHKSLYYSSKILNSHADSASG